MKEPRSRSGRCAADGGRSGNPSWSPSGGPLACGETVGLREAGGVWIYNLASGAGEKLAGTAGLFEPRWSPLGGVIAALHPDGPDGDATVVLYDLARKSWRPLGHIVGGFLTWSHDGRSLYFYDRRDKSANHIASMDQAGHISVVASLAGVSQPVSVFGTWVGLDPEDHPLVIHDLSDDELYALDWVGQ
ncbi:MAG: TolB family protein [Terriglobales bacterium]